MRAALLCVLVLACAPALASAQTPATTPATTPPAATTAVPTTTAPATTATTTTTPGSVEINAPADTGDDSNTSPAVVGLLVALALAVLIGLAWALLRLTAWEPEWLPRLRHSVGEAAYRFGGGWAQFRDWLTPNRR